jgi:hypothetical protein
VHAHRRLHKEQQCLELYNAAVNRTLSAMGGAPTKAVAGATLAGIAGAASPPAIPVQLQL